MCAKTCQSWYLGVLWISERPDESTKGFTWCEFEKRYCFVLDLCCRILQDCRSNGCLVELGVCVSCFFEFCSLFTSTPIWILPS